MFLDNNDNEYGNREANILFVKKIQFVLKY